MAVASKCGGMAVRNGLDDLGPHFAVETHPPGSSAARPWRVLNELVHDETKLQARVSQISDALAAISPFPDQSIDRRSAASLAHLGLVARLIAPTLAMAARSGTVLGLDLASTWWRPVVGRVVPLSIPGTAHPTRDKDAERSIGDLIADRVLDGPVRELTAAFAALSMSPKVLWGNVASAVAGAASLLVNVRPQWTTIISPIIAALLEHPLLAGSGTIDATTRFRRNSCCLLYQIARGTRGTVCSDCVLHASPPTEGTI